jgi:hypothetical protein
MAMISLPELFALLVVRSISRMTRKRKQELAQCILHGGMNGFPAPRMASLTPIR